MYSAVYSLEPQVLVFVQVESIQPPSFMGGGRREDGQISNPIQQFH